MERGERTGTGRLPEGSFVFVSYSHADAKAAKAVVEGLEQAGFDVWWDQLISGGERFGSSTSQALEAARAVVVLWSRAARIGIHGSAAYVVMHGAQRLRTLPGPLPGRSCVRDEHCHHCPRSPRRILAPAFRRTRIGQGQAPSAGS